MLVSCGYVGDPLPPALNIPGRITDLRVIQRAGKIVVTFTIPQLTTEGLLLDKKLGAVELLAGGWGSEPFNADAWNASARLVPVAAPGIGGNRVEVPSAEWTNQEVFFRVRAINRKGRGGDWSDFAVLRVFPPLEKPTGLRCQAVAEGVRLAWHGPGSPPGVAFRIFRLDGEEKEPAILATTGEPTWVDAATRYGIRYEYSVQAFVKSGNGEAQSETSDPAAITPEDRFPPGVPSGLTALAGVESIELSWERNTEADLAGYAVYRSAEEQGFRKITDLVAIPSFSDRGVERGKRYRYAVSSVDRNGNESQRSPAVEASVP